MKNKDISFWLYMEPYTFIFEGINTRIVYNTLNGSYLQFVDNVVLEILDDLVLLDNGYCIPISKELAKNRSVISFVRKIRSTFSGDIFVDKEMKKSNKPFIFSPKLCLYHDVERIKKEQGRSLGEVILRNISNVTCFLPGECSHSCKFCSFYYRQFIHCSKFNCEKNLSTDDYCKLFERFAASGLNKLNLVLNDLSSQILKSLLIQLKKFTFGIELYLDIKNLNENIAYILKEGYNVNITISLSDCKKEDVYDIISFYKNDKIYWIIIVDNDECLDFINKYYNGNNISILPFYNGNNNSFFYDNVYISMADIVNTPISKQQIFRRQVLNEYFFGKLYISPSGYAYTNMNLPSLGNILKDSLGSILLKEFENSQSWLKTRNVGICKKCENRYLCPSISNYEFVIGKDNLCHIYE